MRTVASCGEGCRRGASFLFPDSDFPLVFPPTWRQSDAETGLIRAVVRGRGCRRAENGRYANHETALMFPIVLPARYPISAIVVGATLRHDLRATGTLSMFAPEGARCAPTPPLVNAAVSRLQNVSKIPVEIGRREWTPAHRIAGANPLVSRNLHPEVARHHQLRKTLRIGFDSRRLQTP